MPVVSDAVVVGGGLVGCLAARALAADGHSIVLYERGAALGREASAAAAGLLAPQMEGAEGLLVAGEAAGKHEAMWALCLAARDRYRDFVAALEAETGERVHYRGDGTLVLALDELAAVAAEAIAERQRSRGLRAEVLTGEEARRLEPLVTPRAIAALHLPDDHQVDNVALADAAALAASRFPRVAVRTGARVRRVLVENGRVAGVALDGDRVAAPFLVLAAGAWTGGLEGLPRPLPVRPVKGQMIALLPEELPMRIVGAAGVYCVPRDDGRLLVGATVEEAGFDVRVTDDAIAALASSSSRLLPSLLEAPVVRRWAGLRPGTPDGLPILGPEPALPGLVYATGHFRNGILLAPITAEGVAAFARGDPPPFDPAAFAPDRAFD